ncbi:hypothetical protein HanRHA438_Chr17g0809581 [Helianthus annuus]|nr:hypothetical protein HanRHA438_Chr17g0809581 [Helianthus annuus]
MSDRLGCSFEQPSRSAGILTWSALRLTLGCFDYFDIISRYSDNELNHRRGFLLASLVRTGITQIRLVNCSDR